MSIAPEARGGAGERCARCGAGFECALRTGAERCWCAELPPLEPVAGEGCLCPNCLRAALAAARRASGSASA